MAITWQVHDSGRLDVVFAGPYTAEESERVMTDIYAQPGLSRPLRFLVDVRQTTPPDTEFVVRAITFWQLHITDMWGARIAVVTATEGQMNMAGISSDTVEWRNLPFTVRPFRESEWEDAELWLASPPDASAP
jgi:hypothetical protein